MCFHYSITKERSIIANKLRADWTDEHWKPIYHADGFRFLKMPVITCDNPSIIQLFHWGLIPGWIKTKKEADQIKNYTLNARSETVFQKPSFRYSITSNRCLIPADGFFEWMAFNKKKYPHYIFLKNHELFCFAGIFSVWTDRETGEMIPTFSILTTEANTTLQRIHNIKKRMPVILDPIHYPDWLNPSLSSEQITPMFSRLASARIDYYSISRLITAKTAHAHDPAIIEPMIYPELP